MPFHIPIPIPILILITTSCRTTAASSGIENFPAISIFLGHADVDANADSYISRSLDSAIEREGRGDNFRSIDRSCNDIM